MQDPSITNQPFLPASSRIFAYAKSNCDKVPVLCSDIISLITPLGGKMPFSCRINGFCKALVGILLGFKEGHGTQFYHWMPRDHVFHSVVIPPVWNLWATYLSIIQYYLGGAVCVWSNVYLPTQWLTTYKNDQNLWSAVC